MFREKKKRQRRSYIQCDWNEQPGNDKPTQIHTNLHRNRNRRVNSRGNGRTWKACDNQSTVFPRESGILDVGSNIVSSTNKKARKGHFLLVEKGRKEATSKNAEEGEGSNPGVRWKEGHPENRSQGAKPAKAAPKASLTAGCSHRFHQNLGRRGKIPAAGK